MDLQTFLQKLLTFLNDVIVPFILAVAFLVFLWNAVRYFIIGGGSTEEQEKARSLATWGIAAFVVILSLWSIVNMLVSGFNLGRTNPITPDYMQSNNESLNRGDNGQTDPGWINP